MARKVTCEDCGCFYFDSCSVLSAGTTFATCVALALLKYLKSGSKAPNCYFIFGRELSNVLQHLALAGFPTLLLIPIICCENSRFERDFLVPALHPAWEFIDNCFSIYISF